MDGLKEVFAEWVRLDRKNCDLVRQGLLRFRMPDSYRVNESPRRSVVEMGNARPELSQIGRGIVTAAEGAECIGGQLGHSGDLTAALFAALFVDHLQQTYPIVFENELHWRTRLPGELGKIVCNGLNNGNGYLYEGIESVTKMLLSDKRVSAFLADQIAAEPDAAAESEQLH